MNSTNISKSILGAARLKVLPLALMLAAGAAQAQGAGDMFSFSGFGTVGVAHSNSDKGDFASTLFQRSGAGASRSWDFNSDTKAGAQVTARINEQWSAVVQVVSMARSNNTFAPRLEWANVQYAFTPDIKVRVGRSALPTYMASDTRLVGYANAWLRPPVEVYSDSPMTNLDGVDLSYRSRFGRVMNTMQVFVGRSNINTVGESGDELPVNNIRQAKGFANSVEYGAWTGRVSYMQSNIRFDVGGGASVITPHKTVAFGAAYDPGEWFVQGEFTSVKLPGIMPTAKGAYLIGGYRFGDVAPFLIRSQGWSQHGDGPGMFDQRTTSLGVRWDAMKNIAVKMQVDQIRPTAGSAGYFINVRPGLSGTNVRLVSLAVDFVF